MFSCGGPRWHALQSAPRLRTPAQEIDLLQRWLVGLLLQRQEELIRAQGPQRGAPAPQAKAVRVSEAPVLSEQSPATRLCAPRSFDPAIRS